MTKTNTRSRIVSILLVLAMLLTMVPITGVTASAAEDDTSYQQAEIWDYESFEAQLRSYESRDLKLMEDINYTVGIDDDSIYVMCNQKLDLNGHKITIDASRRAGFENLLCIRRGEFTLYDSSKGGGGELAVSFPDDDKAYSIIMMSSEKKDEPSKFTMNGGTLTKLHPNMTYTYGASGCIGDDYFNKPENGKRSQITINGGTINCPYAYKWDRSKPLLSLPVKAMPLALQLLYSNLTINGGTFNGIVWTDLLWRGEQDTEPRVVLNGGEFNAPFVVEDMSRTETQMVIDGAHFNDGFHVNNKYSKNTDVGTVPQLLLKSGVFTSPDENPKLDIYNATAAHGDSSITKNRVILHAMKCFPNSAIKVNGKIYTSENINSLVRSNDTGYYLNFKSSTPIEVIPNAWGVMKSVTLDGNPIDYFKDWKGTVERMDNSTAHTIKFEWYPLASELVNAGYSYNARCDHYISGSSAVQQTDTIAAGATSHTVTIPAGADPKVYSFDLHLNLKKDGSSIGIYTNQHIVKLVVSEAPVVEPDPTIEGSVYYTSGIVFGRSISTAASVTPAEATKAYQWQRSTNGGSNWTNIDGATRGSYTPVAADMGENVRIRVVVTAEGYLGEIVGAAVKVSKAANNNYPEAIKLKAVKNGAGNYTGFKITNFDSDCEYVYSTTDTPNWSTNQISSATVTGLTSDTTYYVFARFKETNTHTAGSIVSKNSIRLYDYVPLERVLLEGYGSSGTIYIKKGESVTLKVNADPSNANSWKEITFKDEGATTSNIAISNGKINASTGTATPFPNGHTITITGVSKGSANLRASYPSATSSAYGTWYVVVYDDSTVANALRLESVYAYEDITLSENDTAELPTNLPKLLPENSGYHLEWRILKRGTYGASYVTENENIKLENDKIIPIKAHTGSEKTQLELVAVKDGSDTYRTLPKTSLFYVTVTEAPVIELTGVTVAPTKVNLELNATYQLSAVKEPVNAAGSLNWESSNPGVATVDSTGKVTAKARGTAIITVSCGDKKDTCTVTVDHQHDYTGQPYLYLDPGNHYQECKAGDGYNIQAHEFTPWTDNGNGTHSRHCTVCKMTDGSTYTETAEHTWVWVVDQEAALNQPGKQHEECTGCHAKRSENTEIPALRDYAVTVTGGTATVAAGTSITRAMEGVEVTVTAQAPDGKHFVKWVVKAGGVTLANETSATTTFTMPANDVTIEAEIAENPVESYTLTVIKGTASVAAGTPITDKIEQNTVVTVTADAPETGKVFDKWVVLEGNVTLTDATKATTTFTMPGNDVKIEATYKEAPPSDTHSYGVYVGMTYTAGNFIYQITSIDTATLGQSKVIGVVAAKKNKIKKVTIPDRADCKGYRLNVTTIGNNAFAGCKVLEKLTIGNKVTVIGKNAFKKCSKLKTVVIGKAVKTISSKAFIGDNKIKKITFKGDKLKTVKKNAFSKKAKKNIKSKKTKLKGNKKAIKLFKKKLKIK